MSPVLASMVLSMLATPLIILYSNRIVMRLVGQRLAAAVGGDDDDRAARRSTPRRTSSSAATAAAARTWRACSRARSIPYIALDLDPDRVRQAAAAGQSVVFGDAARLQSLMAAGLARASAVVVSYHDTPSALKILHLVRAHAPHGAGDRAHDRRHATSRSCSAAGATEVVPEAIEGSLMLASHALALVGVPMRRVIRVVQDAARRALRPAARLLPRRRRRHRRRARPGAAAQRHACLPGSGSIGRALGELALRRARRERRVAAARLGRGAAADDPLALAAGDTLVLSGLPERAGAAPRRRC